MTNQEIKMALARFNETMASIEDTIIENGGELTEETEHQMSVAEELKELLTGEGIDSLGRWLVSKEDEIKRLKAERDSVNRKINAVNNTIDYIKYMVNQVLSQTGENDAKGTFYSFTKTTSVKTEVEKAMLKLMFQDAVEKTLRGRKKPIIPADVTITLGASVKAVPEGSDLPVYFTQTETPSVRFVKPRISKTDE